MGRARKNVSRNFDFIIKKEIVLSSKNTHWKRMGSNIEDSRTREEKIVDQRRSFYNGLAIDRMKTNKPSFKNSKKNNSEEETEE